MTPQSWGGSRPNSGGSRPNSGPLKRRLTIRPFAHTEKGESHSSVTVQIDRCNHCGAIGWEIAEDESLYRYGQPENEGFVEVEGVAGQPLVHEADCPFR